MCLQTILDFFTSTRRPKKGVSVLTVEELKKKILAENRDTAPYHIVDGSGENVDFIAEWKIVDAKWYEIFAKAGTKQVFKIYLKIHPETHEVRALDKKYSVSWSAGVPNLSASASLFVGQTQEISSGTAYAFTEELKYGKVYNYRFSTNEIKKPLQQAVTECGWIYKGVGSNGKL
jgi:hypothetical protein